MRFWILLAERPGEEAEACAVRRRVLPEVDEADGPNLEQDQTGRGVEAPRTEEKVGGLAQDPPVGSRVHSEIGKEAVFKGDRRQHLGGKTFLSRPSQALQPGRHADGRVTVEGCADLMARANRGQDALDHPLAGRLSRLAL